MYQEQAIEQMQRAEAYAALAADIKATKKAVKIIVDCALGTETEPITREQLIQGVNRVMTALFPTLSPRLSRYLWNFSRQNSVS